VLDSVALTRFRLDRVRIVLVRPSRPANVAAACRALKNMGVRSIGRVGTEPLAFTPADRALAYGAWDVLDSIETVATLAEATADCTLVVGTSGRSAVASWTPRHLGEVAAGLGQDASLGLVFGPEASGLRNDELGLCHACVHVPTDPAQPSLNLAQAVLLLAYELRLSALAEAETGPAPCAALPDETMARATEMESALSELRRALLAIGYLNPDNPEAILVELRRLIARAAPTRRETSLLRGMARQILWAGQHVARGEGGDA
jgi:tRNA (cytidine32/uridine32-2'-O)-methyltransferase